MSKGNSRSISSSEVLDRLRKLILDGNLQPGDRLPAERTLAAELGVGRPAIRESIKALQILDVLDSRHGGGTFVRSLAGLPGGWPSQVGLPNRQVDLLDLLEVRKMIEPRAAALAAARRDDQQLYLMERELLSQERDPSNRDLLIRHDYLFHEEIMRAAGNSVLQDIARRLSPLLMMSRKLTARTTPDTRLVIKQHRTIFESIRLRDPDSAEQAMKEHLQQTGLDLITSESSRKRTVRDSRVSKDQA